jgi:hypothetical protein
MAARALTLWREAEKSWKKKLYHRTGALWMASDDESFVRSSVPMLRESRFRFEELSAAKLRKRYPQVNFEGVRWGLLENDAGYLLARRSCADVVEGLLSERGRYIEAAAEPPDVSSNRNRFAASASRMERISSRTTSSSCGPWLPNLFRTSWNASSPPDVLFSGAGGEMFSRWLPICSRTAVLASHCGADFKIADTRGGGSTDRRRSPRHDGGRGGESTLRGDSGLEKRSIISRASGESSRINASSTSIPPLRIWIVVSSTTEAARL